MIRGDFELERIVRNFGSYLAIVVVTEPFMARNAHQPPTVALAATLVLVSLAGGAPAQEPIGPATLTLPSSAAAAASSPFPGVPRPQPALADFAWLAGEWHGTWGPRLATEAWTPPHAGVMLGSFQLSENGKTLVLELLSLTEDDGTLKLHIRHFTPSLDAWEKQDPVTLNLQSADATTAVFENPADGEPKTATFTRLDADTYASRFELTSEKSDPHITQIVYHRQIAGSQQTRSKRKPKPQAP
ncbi:MAG TPA: DUF6265 family protein [Candidatus Acidoferrales bacterium]|nr:DUF6265 family protein [Candidatus Acidoferrales bacterium]